jgi:hypothetical protein
MWNNREFSSPALFWPQVARDWFGEAIDDDCAVASLLSISADRGRSLAALRINQHEHIPR